MKYANNWDLSTIPEDVWNSEAGRRRRAKGPTATNINLKPCKHCKKPLTTVQRRGACPNCGQRGNRDN